MNQYTVFKWEDNHKQYFQCQLGKKFTIGICAEKNKSKKLKNDIINSLLIIESLEIDLETGKNKKGQHYEDLLNARAYSDLIQNNYKKLYTEIKKKIIWKNEKFTSIFRE